MKDFWDKLSSALQSFIYVLIALFIIFLMFKIARYKSQSNTEILGADGMNIPRNYVAITDRLQPQTVTITFVPAFGADVPETSLNTTSAA